MRRFAFALAILSSACASSPGRGSPSWAETARDDANTVASFDFAELDDEIPPCGLVELASAPAEDREVFATTTRRLVAAGAPPCTDAE